MNIYLYIKQCTHCQLKYFGKTSQSNPYEYKGSGKRWRNHLKKHKASVITLEVFSFDNEQDAKEFALAFSREHSIVESKEWANLIEEDALCGGSRPYNKEANKKNSKLGGFAKAAKGYPVWNKGLKTGPDSEETKRKKSASRTGNRRSYREDGTWFWIKPTLPSPQQDSTLEPS